MAFNSLDHTTSCIGKDIGRAMEEVIAETGMQWRVAIRNGDTDIAERQKQNAICPRC